MSDSGFAAGAQAGIAAGGAASSGFGGSLLSGLGVGGGRAIQDSTGSPIYDSVGGPIQDGPRRGAGAVEAAVVATITGLLSAGLRGALTGPPVWGIFDQYGQPIINADSVSRFNFRKEKHIADHPIEDGQFASYNKVSLPTDCRISFLQAESDDQRSSLLSTIDGICEDLNLYTILTPNAAYDNINIVGYDYDRTSQEGVKLLRVDVRCREVRTVAPSAYTEPDNADQVQDSSGANVHDGGVVQSQAPSPATRAMVGRQSKNFNPRAHDAPGGV